MCREGARGCCVVRTKALLPVEQGKPFFRHNEQGSSPDLSHFLCFALHRSQATETLAISKALKEIYFLVVG